MADPVSAIALGVAVVSFAGTVKQIIERFVSDWKSAPEDIKGYKRELETLRDTVLRTAEITAQKPVAGLRDEINSCQIELCKLRDAMNLPPNAWGRLRTAIRAESLVESIQKVRRRCEDIDHIVNLEILGNSRAGADTIGRFQAVVENRIRDENESKILSWISKMDFKNRHENLLQQHHEGTGEWLISRDDFIDWRNGCRMDEQDNEVRPILWCHGIPGAGKSVMTSFVVEHCKSVLGLDPKPAIVYIYCDYKERNTQSTRDLMSSLLKQALLQFSKSEGMPPEAVNAYQNNAQGDTKIGYGELKALLTKVLQRFYRSILVIDALDEYVGSDDEAHEIFDALREVMSDCHGTCRMFVTSRGDCYTQYQGKVQAIEIEIMAREQDIRSYAHSFIQSDRFRHVEKVRRDEDLAQRIINSISKKSCGQFLLPALHLKELQHQPSIRDVEEELERLPTTLYGAYSIAVNRIQSQPLGHIGMRILAWIIHAYRPLTVRELQHAFATRNKDTHFDERGIMDASEFITRTAGLLAIRNERVQCVHHTIEEFFKDEQLGCQDKAWSRDSEKKIAETCLKYLQFEDFKDPSDDLENRLSEFPFLDYAALHWGHHASNCLEQEPGLLRDFSKIFEADGIPLGSLQVIAKKVLQIPRSGRISIWKNNTPKLHMAVAFGLDKFIEMIIMNDEVDLEEPGYKQETALHMAARSSRKRATELLLQHKANVNATNWSGKTALDMIMLTPWQRVSMRVNEREFFEVFLYSIVSRLFVESSGSLPQELSEIDKNTKGSLESPQTQGILEEFGTPRRSQEASQKETDSIMKQLIIARGYKMDITEEDEEIVRLLLDAKIDVNSQGHPEATALQLSVIYGKRNLVQLLLEKDANPFLVRDLGYDALTLAKHRGHKDIEQLLEQKMELLRKLEMEKVDNEAKLGIPGPFQAKHLEDQALQEERNRIMRMQQYKAKGEPDALPEVLLVLRLKVDRERTAQMQHPG